jgi:hypothetical protein
MVFLCPPVPLKRIFSRKSFVTFGTSMFLLVGVNGFVMPHSVTLPLKLSATNLTSSPVPRILLQAQVFRAIFLGCPSR